MSRQYGEPPEPKGAQKGNAYGRANEPKTKDPDPSPARDVVELFHKNAPVDTRPEDIHHTIGPGGAAAYDHQHKELLTGVTLTGSKGGNVALANVINVLVTHFGLKDSTT